MINAWKKFWPVPEESRRDEQIQVQESARMFQDISNVIERLPLVLKNVIKTMCISGWKVTSATQDFRS